MWLLGRDRRWRWLRRALAGYVGGGTRGQGFTKDSVHHKSKRPHYSHHQMITISFPPPHPPPYRSWPMRSTRAPELSREHLARAPSLSSMTGYRLGGSRKRKPISLHAALRIARSATPRPTGIPATSVKSWAIPPRCAVPSTHTDSPILRAVSSLMPHILRSTPRTTYAGSTSALPPQLLASIQRTWRVTPTSKRIVEDIELLPEC